MAVTTLYRTKLSSQNARSVRDCRATLEKENSCRRISYKAFTHVEALNLLRNLIFGLRNTEAAIFSGPSFEQVEGMANRCLPDSPLLANLLRYN